MDVVRDLQLLANPWRIRLLVLVMHLRRGRALIVGLAVPWM